MKLIKDQEVINTLIDLGNFGKGDAEWLVSKMSTVKAIQIPNNATNGEIILSLFPYAETRAEEDECCMKVHFPGAFNVECFDLFWWNDNYDDDWNKNS